MNTLKPYTNPKTEFMLRNNSTSFSHIGEYYGALDLSDKRMAAPPIIDYNNARIIDANGIHSRNELKKGGGWKN